MIDFHPLPSNPDELTAEHARLVFGDAATVTRVILAAVLEWQAAAAPDTEPPSQSTVAPPP